jgi:riboflavin synthase
VNIEIDPHTQAIVETVERVLAQRDAAAAMSMLTGQSTTES